jgi:putative ABC transport system permease protein
MLHRRVSRARKPTDDEIARELRDHVELETEAAGGDGDAPSRARRRFGNLGRTTEDIRAVWHWTWLDNLRQDVRVGWRGLRRSPVYASAAAVTLALGIGGSTAVFSFGDHILRRPFPLLPQNELVWIVQRSKQCPGCSGAASPGAYVALRDHARTLSAVSAVSSWRAALNGPSGSDLVQGYLVTANLFSTIGAPFALGHGFSAGSDRPGHDAVVVLSFEFWRRRFQESAGVLDSVVVINGRPRHVVGVLAPDVVFPMAADAYAPLVLTSADEDNYGGRYLDVFARLAPGSSMRAAEAEGALISRRLAITSPATDADWTVSERPLRTFHTDDARPLIDIFIVAVALVLLAACMSVANLALARAAARRREMAVRAALGGRRARLVRHVFVEALLVAVTGGVLGIGLAAWGIHAATGIIPRSMSDIVPGFAQVTIDTPAVAFAATLCVATTLLFATLPALRASQIHLTSVLGDGSRGNAGDAHGTRLRAVLVVAEVSVALVLLSGSALLTRSVRNMLNGNPGIRRDHLLTMPLSLAATMTGSAERVVIRRLDERLHATPGVLGAGLTSTTPLSNSSWGTAFGIPGRPSQHGHDALSATDERVTPDYFRTMGIRVVTGRGFDARDLDSARRAVVVSESMRREFWSDADPVGQVITIDSLPWTIVGVASDVWHGGMDESLPNEIYRPVQQAPQHLAELEVWTAGEPRAMAIAIRRVIAAVEPSVAVGQIMTMREMEARHVSPFRFTADVVSAFAVVTLLIAVVGLYGIIAYGVAQRTREIGVRIALGATRRDILSHIALGALRLTATGVLVGGAGALGFAQLLRFALYGVTAADPRTPLLIAAFVLVVGLVAALVPAWRAAQLNPTIALRE